jgi:hypothetical protein
MTNPLHFSFECATRCRSGERDVGEPLPGAARFTRCHFVFCLVTAVLFSCGAGPDTPTDAGRNVGGGAVGGGSAGGNLPSGGGSAVASGGDSVGGGSAAGGGDAVGGGSVGGGSAVGGGSTVGGGSAAGGGSSSPVLANAKIRFFHADSCNADNGIIGIAGAVTSGIGSYNKSSNWADISSTSTVASRIVAPDGSSYGEKTFTLVDGNRYLSIATVDRAPGLPFRKKGTMVVASTPMSGPDSRLTFVNASFNPVDVYLTGGEGPTGIPQATLGGFTQAEPLTVLPNIYRLIVTTKGDRSAILFDTAGTDLRTSSGDDLLLVIPPFRDCRRAMRLQIMNMKPGGKDSVLLTNLANMNFVSVEYRGSEAGLDVIVSLEGTPIATVQTLKPGVNIDLFTTPGSRTIKNEMLNVARESPLWLERGKYNSIVARCYAFYLFGRFTRTCDDPYVVVGPEYPF